MLKISQLNGEILSAHANWHNCESDGKLITQAGGCKVHIQTHSGKNPYNCKQCKKSLSQAGWLKKHLQIHCGEKPHACKCKQVKIIILAKSVKSCSVKFFISRCPSVPIAWHSRTKTYSFHKINITF